MMQHVGCSTFVICLCCICIAGIKFLLLLLHFCFRAQNHCRPNAILTSGQDYKEKVLSCSGYTLCPEQSSWLYNAPTTQLIRSNRPTLLHCISSRVLQAECTCPIFTQIILRAVPHTPGEVLKMHNLLAAPRALTRLVAFE